MADNFHTSSLKFLLAQTFLIPPERRVLEVLLGAATLGVYWDQLRRMVIREPDARVIIDNIVTKTRAAGLQPILEQLKAHYDKVPDVPSDVRDGADAEVPAAV